MIVDKINNMDVYKNISGRLAKALEFLANEDFSKKQPGRYEIDGDNIFYMVQKYQTAPAKDGKFETHKRYIDIQFVAQGQEMLGYIPIDNLKVNKPYDQAGDFEFYNVPEEYTAVELRTGMFCILFPEDGHMPSRQLQNQTDVLKVVVKVKID